MTGPSDDYEVGYGRPPKATRWKKGQSGNPRSRKRKRTVSTLEIIDALLVRQIQITLNGEVRKETGLAAIIIQLQQKAMSGNISASRTLMEYQKFASQNTKKRPELTFVESDYTRAFTALDSTNHDG